MALVIASASIHGLLPIQSDHAISSVPMALLTGIAGFVVMMLAWWQFKQDKIAICPTEATDHLITDGVYRMTRNPMYLGMIMILFGIAAFFGTWPFYAAAVVYFAIINWAFCPYEEAKLTSAFGQEYLNFKARTRRWI